MTSQICSPMFISRFPFRNLYVKWYSSITVQQLRMNIKMTFLSSVLKCPNSVNEQTNMGVL